MSDRFMSDRPTIRRRGEADGAALLELINEDLFQDMASTRRPFETCEELRGWLDGLAERRFEIVAVVNGAAIGFGGLYLMNDHLDHSGWICLGVRKEFQRRGIGAALLETLVATADVLAGLERVQLTVFCDNEAAIKLYGFFGFEIEGRHRRFRRRGAAFVDAFTMARLAKEANGALARPRSLQKIQQLRPLWAPTPI